VITFTPSDDEDPRPASELYKEIVGRGHAAVERIQQQDKQRVAQVERELEDAHSRFLEASEQERVARMTVHLLWEAAIEALWDEHWLTITPLPEPDKNAPQRERKYFDREIDRTYQELEEALKKRGLLPRRGRA
jgi:hypothetical protein